MGKKGLFIAFEGIDGCGKSTQIRKLVQHLFEKSKYNHIVLTRNPYKNINIRQILTEDSDPYTQAELLAQLYITDREHQVEETVKPNLEKGHLVLTDRYKFSTIAYQGAQGLDMGELISRQAHLPVPDATFIIDVPATIARERMHKEDVSVRGKEHKFEANIDFAVQLRDNYLKAAGMLQAQKEHIFVIDGNRHPDEIFGEIKNIIDNVILSPPAHTAV